MPAPGTVRGVVLAGGASSRFGDGDKALADLGGRPLIAHAAGPVAEATGETLLLAVASDHERERLLDALAVPASTVVDVPEFSGPLAGLFAAAEATTAPWLFVCGCDMPLVTADGVAAVLAAAGDGVAAVVPRVDGHDQPLHACYRRSRLAAVRDDLADGDGLVDLVAALEDVARPTGDELDVPLAAAVTNVNTRADLERIRATVET